MRKFHLSHPMCPDTTATHLQTQSRAALRVTLLGTYLRLSIAVSDCSAGQGSNVHSFSPNSSQGTHYSPLSHYFPSSLLYTHYSSACTKGQRLHLCAWQLLPTCRNPLVSAASSATDLNPAWEKRMTAPSTSYLCSQVHTHHLKNNPDVFVVVQTSSFLVYKN